MFEFDPEVIIPEQCQGCGVQCEIGLQFMSLLFMKHMTTHVGQKMVGEDGAAFDALIDEQAPAEIADDIKQGIRKMIGEDLSDIDDRIEEAKQDMAANALACNGVLKMRASRGDVTYTVNVCTSPRVYRRDSALPEHLPTHIRVESVHR